MNLQRNSNGAPEIRGGIHWNLAFFAALLLVQSLSASGFAQAPDPDASLRKRMTGFWEAVQKEDYAAASRFVRPDSREYFAYKAPRSRFSGWTIDKLEFNPEKTACQTTILIKKPIPFFGKEMDWPLKHEWTVFEGDWYLNLATIADRSSSNDFFRLLAETELQASKLSQQPDAHEHNAAAAGQPSPSDPRNRDYWFRLEANPQNPTEVLSGEKAVFRYEYRNQTKMPFRILGARADCHCTAVNTNFPEVAPGESSTLEITLDTFGLPLGPIEKEVQVEFSDLSYAIPLKIRVTHAPNLVIEPRSVDFGDLQSGVTVEKSIRITNGSRKRVQFFQYPADGSTIAVSLDKTVLDPKESLTVTLRYTPNVTGEILSGIWLRTNLESDPTISVRIMARVAPR